MFKKLFSNSLSKIVLYCLFAIFFFVGYFLGATQTTDWCNERYCFERVKEKMKRQIESPKYHVKLVVLVFSAPENERRRDTVRNTWFLTKGTLSVLNFFVIGTASLDYEVKRDLEKEKVMNGDLLLLPNVSDSYSKLSKKLLEAFKWVDNHTSHSFLLKVDDDSFVRLDSLFKQLKHKPREKVYWGFFDGRARVKTRGKWTEEHWHLCDTYLPYAKGGGYVVTSDLTRYVAQNSDFLSLYKNEDVSLGAWLSPLDIKRIHDPNFDTEFQSRGCFNSYLVTHKQSQAMMVDKYKSLVKLGNMCPTEHRNRLSYVYNWNVPPSLCCVRNDSRIP